MTNVTLQISQDDDLRLLLELIRRLDLAIVNITPNPAVVVASERQRMIAFIQSYTNDNPSFGDAAAWQQQERADRALPFSA